MKLHALILTGLLAIAGCEKSSNVTALQEETNGLANHYKQRLEELQKRIALLEQRGRTMVSVGQPEGLNDVRKLFLDTNKRLAELKSVASGVAGAVNNASKAADPRAELIKVLGETHARLEKGETEVTANIDAVEQWLAYVEFRPKVAAAPPAPDPKVPEPMPEHPDSLKKDPGAPADAPKPEPKKDEPAAKKDEPKKDEPAAKKDEPKKDLPKAEPKKDAPKAGSGSAR